jgi:Tol biopolymer transport system component
MKAAARRGRFLHCVGFGILVFLLLTPMAGADEDAVILRRGFFAELTDTESALFDIYTFRMSGDGTRVAYYGYNGTNTELRVIDGDGSNDTLIEEAEQYWGLLKGLYDISDDGSTIVYFRYTSIADPTPELVVYDVATMARTQILKTLPVSHYGTPEDWVLKPQEDPKLIRLSGDGSKVFFVNQWGPVFGVPYFSGLTIYSINTDGSGLTAVFEADKIQSIPGIGVDTTSLGIWESEIATDFTGSKLVVPMSGSWGETDLVVMNGDGSNPTVIQDVRDGAFYGAAMSADGTKIVYSRGGTALPEDTGIFVTGPGLPQNPVRVEPNSGYWWVYPEISTDGGSVVYNFDQGGGSSPAIRWANASGIRRLPISYLIVAAHSAKAMVAEGGKTMFMLGTTSRNGYKELMRFDFTTTPFVGMPRVDSVSGSPDMSIGNGDGYYTFFYSTTGSNLREMYAFPFTDDPAELDFSFFGGFEDWGYLYDDGSTGGDVTAGDGIFTDDGVYLNVAPPVEFFTVRAGVASDEGVAAFADFACAFGDDYVEIFSDRFESGNTTRWTSTVP